MTDDFWAGAEVLHAYTRAQAIEDGTLVAVEFEDEPDFARQAGFLCHVALTRTLYELVAPNDEEQSWGQDLKGRMWDTLNMARFGRPRPIPAEGATWLYQCIFYLADREGYRRGSRTLTLKAIIGPGDQGEPVVTIMMPDED